MPWLRRAGGSPPAAPLETPLSDLDPATLEVLEVDGAGRLSGLPRWKDDSLREVPYAPGAHDPGSLAGLWEGLARA